VSECNKPIRFLLVDDEERIRRVVSEMITSRCEATVCTVDSGEQALLTLENNSFDIVLADVVMPGIDGYELAATVVEKYNIPVILMSGYDIDGLLKEEVTQGLICCLHKPFTLTEIEEAATKAIKIKENMRENHDRTQVRA
jgi:DNA-binding NtrC family response regulator